MNRALARVAVERRVEREADQLVGLESGVQRLQVVEAAREQAGAGEQQHRQADLCDDQPLAQPRVAGAADHAAGLVLQRRCQRRPRRLQRRREAEQHRRHQRCGDREGDHAQVGHRRQRLRRRRRSAASFSSSAPVHQASAEAEQRAGARQHGALDQPLPHDRAAAGAEREADRHFLLPRRAARQQQVRDVGAGDQQHEPDHAHQHQNRRRELLAQIRLAPSGRDAGTDAWRGSDRETAARRWSAARAPAR